MRSGKINIFYLLILFCFILTCRNSYGQDISSVELSPVEYHQLAAERLQQAALFYDRWQNGSDAENFQQAIVYAASAAEIRPGWDEPWLLLGILYSELKADQ